MPRRHGVRPTARPRQPPWWSHAGWRTLRRCDLRPTQSAFVHMPTWEAMFQLLGIWSVWKPTLRDRPPSGPRRSDVGAHGNYRRTAWTRLRRCAASGVCHRLAARLQVDRRVRWYCTPTARPRGDDHRLLPPAHRRAAPSARAVAVRRGDDTRPRSGRTGQTQPTIGGRPGLARQSGPPDVAPP
jgi:hypothetical protein